MDQDWAGQPFYFENYQVGDCYPTVSHQVSKEAVIAFARQWDPQPWHIDEAAARDSLFGGLTACSAHVFSIFSSISPQWRNGAIQQPLASLGFDQMRMLRPVYAGDTVHCVSTIESARRSSSKPDRGIVSSRVDMYNQSGEHLFSILATFIIAGDPALLQDSTTPN